MIRSTTARTLVVATAAMTAAGLVAATPAAAHTNNLYSYIRESDPDYVPDFEGFGAINKSDGVITPLATQAPMAPEGEYLLAGIEVANEKGTALGYTEAGTFVVEWNHTTGAAGVPVAAYLTAALENVEFIGLDTLNNGTTVTIAFYTEQVGDVFFNRMAIASVNAGTGELVPLVDFWATLAIEGEVNYRINSLATDPATGITYVFMTNEGGESFFLPIDVAAGTVGEPTLFQGDGFEFGEILGADFDPGDGSLYFIFDDDEDFLLSKLGKPAGWVNEARQEISTAPAQFNSYLLERYALTAETPALAATGSELPLAALVVGGTLAVIAGGVTVTVARRRSEVGTV